MPQADLTKNVFYSSFSSFFYFYFWNLFFLFSFFFVGLVIRYLFLLVPVPVPLLLNVFVHVCVPVIVPFLVFIHLFFGCSSVVFVFKSLIFLLLMFELGQFMRNWCGYLID